MRRSIILPAGFMVIQHTGLFVIPTWIDEPFRRKRQAKVQATIRWIAVSLMMVGTSLGQAPLTAQTTAPVVEARAPSAPAAEASGGTISGTVKAGAVPLPGVGVTATNTLTGKKYATTTDQSGAFAMAIPRNGRYVVKAELAAFGTDTKEVLIN